ncbi:MAG: sec-independent protein translocase protein TatA [Verrucomicrobiales bacterium]|jgi:sec-independent protein translocase protein TatA
MGSISEIWIVLIIVVVLFGAKALPKLAKSIGQAKNEFEKGAKEGDTAAESASK